MNFFSKLNLPRMYIEAVIIMAVGAFILGISGAIRLGMISSSSKSFELSSEASAEAFHRQGLDRLAEGNYRDAIRSFSYAVVKSPYHTQYLHDLAVAQYNAHDLSAAERTFEELLSIDEENAAAENGLANVLRDSHQFDAALLHYERALLFDPSFLVAYVNEAYLLRDQGKIDAAREVLSRGKAKSGNAAFFERLMNSF